MDKRFQVFVSSTYEDLQEERQEVIQALLELDCIPSGMELFPAADEDQWSLIKNVIDDCDYYLLIVGGRYGSTNDEGTSYTEMEYRYALDQGKPIISFLHKSPGDLAAKRTEKTAKGKKSLEDSRDLAKKKMCQFWETPADLGSKVSRSVMKLIKASPAIGWVRADQLLSEDASQEILSLRRQIEQLEGQLEAAQTSAPAGTEGLSQGDDNTTLKYSFEAVGDYGFKSGSYRAETDLSWNEIFYTLSPHMIDEAAEKELMSAISSRIADEKSEALYENNDFGGDRITNFRINGDSFQTLKVQFKALGLITKSVRNRSVKDKDTYWTLTPYGDTVMSRLRAIRKSNGS